jgi:hypothetical protein
MNTESSIVEPPSERIADELDLSEKDSRPWERPGALRRDCESHRGGLIWFLGTVSSILDCLGFCSGFTAVPALALGITAWCMARRDLDKMDLGLMERDGRLATLDGRRYAMLGSILSIWAGGFWGLAFLWDRLFQ